MRSQNELSDYQAQLRSIFHGEIVPRHRGVNIGAFEEYFEFLIGARGGLVVRRQDIERKRSWFIPGRKRAIREQLEEVLEKLGFLDEEMLFAKNGIRRRTRTSATG